MSEVASLEDQRAIAGELLRIVAALASETSSRPIMTDELTLDTRLDRDLGLDSLAMTELMLRIEQGLGIALRDEALAAVTPRELLQHARAHEPEGVAVELPAPTATTRVPKAARTLIDVLMWHVEQDADRVHVLLYEKPGPPQAISYGQLHKAASAVAGALRARNLMSGQTVCIMLPTSFGYLATFFGVLLAGGIPVPIYPPTRRSQLGDHLRRHARILRNADARLLVTVPEGKAVGRLLAADVPRLTNVVTVADLLDSTVRTPPATRRAQDIAFLQYTSGSTGDPKGVVLTHANLLANIRALVKRVEATPTDVFVSWLPLYHDMGLIGAWLGSLYLGMPLVLMSPLSFLARPARWLWAVHRYRGTLTASPNFGYELCVRKVPDTAIEGLDLSALRYAFNGAEPVRPETIEAFQDRFAAYGLHERAVTPVYGLAESSVALTGPSPGQGAVIDRVRREAFYQTGRAEPARPDDPAPLLWPSCGPPLSGEQVRVVDDAGRELPERREGRIQFKGHSATSGYYQNPEATRQLFAGEWLESGDRGYTVDGQLYVTGRDKDLIIRGGRNIHPYELEEVVGDLPGVRKGCVAAFGARDPATGSERLVIVAETHETSSDRQSQLRDQIERESRELLNVPADEILLVPPHTILKTSSGKIRRHATCQLYEAGTLRGGRLRQERQLALAFVRSSLHRTQQQVVSGLYSGWCWFLIVCAMLVLWLPVVLLPGIERRWRALRAASKLIALLSATDIHVNGLEHLPRKGPFVLAANHSSYLDAFVLATVMPRAVRYVVKRGLKGGLLIRLFLKRLGVVFVERLDTAKSLADFEHVLRAARSNYPLGFFPEGTFFRAPGLLAFHMGAFLTAVEARLAVLPVTILGTRAKLRCDERFIHRGPVQVIVSAPIQASGKGWGAANALRARVRAEILCHSEEPDLTTEQMTIGLSG